MALSDIKLVTTADTTGISTTQTAFNNLSSAGLALLDVLEKINIASAQAKFPGLDAKNVQGLTQSFDPVFNRLTSNLSVLKNGIQATLQELYNINPAVLSKISPQLNATYDQINEIKKQISSLSEQASGLEKDLGTKGKIPAGQRQDTINQVRELRAQIRGLTVDLGEAYNEQIKLLSESGALSPRRAPIPPGYTSVAGLPEVRGALTQAGLGTTLAEVNKQLGANGSFFTVTRNAKTGINELSTAFETQDGVLTKLKLQYTDTGRVISQFGERISGTFKIVGSGASALRATNYISGNLQALLDAERSLGRAELQGEVKNLSPETNPRNVAPNIPYISSANTELDTFNNTLKTTYQVSIQDEQGITHLINSYTKFRSLSEVSTVLEQLNTDFIKNAQAAQEAGLAAEQAAAKLAAIPEYVKASGNLSAATAERDRLLAARAAGETVTPAQLGAQTRIINQSEKILSTDEEIVTAVNQQNTSLARQRGLLEQNAALQARVQSSLRAPLALPTELQTLLKESPQLFAQFQKQGLGLGAGVDPKSAANVSAIYNQGAAESIRLQKDLERNVTNASLSIRDETGKLVTLTGAYNQSGAVITRYGGQLSGLSHYLQQTVNDFVKVTQWTVATSIVFGTLATVTQSLGTIATLDKQLKQLAITSQATSQETAQLFDSLAQVAQRTATPLTELINSADDMALATKKAGESTEDWRKNFLDLAEAVGILTNIAKTDTVQATDQLTAIMKQLNLQASDLVGVLNKVTAVAGGQSVAVNDIVTGLGAMAEASKQAGLSIDQSIATIQVLSQVTSKSAAEVAVSFKNLTGSLGSPGALKIFEKYDIAVKDAKGNLRNILDIYSEINDKIKSGVIATSDVQSVLRGISGGPRRLPDAAALLANIDTISAVTEKSVNATNEALVANAKILDTIPAKITQIQAAFQAFVQSKFGQTFKDVVNSVLHLADTILAALKAIPSSVYSTAIQFGILFLALKVGTLLVHGFFGEFLQGISAIRGLPGVFAGVATGIREFGAATTTVTTAQENQTRATVGNVTAASELAQADNVASTAQVRLATTTQEVVVAENEQAAATSALTLKQELLAKVPAPVQRVGAGFAPGTAGGRALAAGATGAITGAALGAATGASLPQIGGFAAQGLGLALLLDPEPITKVVGLLALIGGTLLPNIGEQQKKVTQDTVENSQELLNAIEVYKEQQDAVDQLTQSQTDLGDAIDKINARQAVGQATADDLQQLSSSQQQYAENTLNLVKANDLLADSLKKVGAAAGITGYQLQFLGNGSLDPNALSQISAKLTEQIFKSVNPDFKGVSSFTFKAPLEVTPPPPSQISDVVAVTQNLIDKRINDYKKSNASGNSFNLGIGSTELTPAQKASVDAIKQQAQSVQDQITQLLKSGPSFLPNTGSLNATTLSGQVFNLAELRDNADAVKQLFDSTGSSIAAAFTPSVESITLINEAIAQLPDDIRNKYQTTFDNLISRVDAFSAAVNQIQINLANLEARKELGLISSKDYETAKGYETLLARVAADAQRISQYNPSATSSNNREDRTGGLNPAGESQAQQLIALANSSLQFDAQGNPIDATREKAIALGRSILETEGKLDDLDKKGATNQAIVKMFVDAGIAAKYFTAAEIEAAKAGDDLLGTLEDSTNAYFAQLIQKRADLQGQFATGAFAGKEPDYYNQLAQVNELISANAQLGDTFQSHATSLDEFRNGLTSINGLESAGIKIGDDYAIKNEDLGQAILANITRYNLSGTAIRKYVQDIIDLADATNRVSVAQADLQTAQQDPNALDPGSAANARLVHAQLELTLAKDSVTRIQSDVEGILVASAPTISDTIAKAIEQGVKDAKTDLANTSLDLLVKLVTGGFTDNTDFGGLTGQASAIDQAREKLLKQFNELGKNGDLNSYEQTLTSIPGFQDAVGVSANDLAARFAALAQKAGLTDAQIKILTADLLANANASQAAGTGAAPGPTDRVTPSADSQKILKDALGPLLNPTTLTAQKAYTNYLESLGGAAVKVFNNLSPQGKIAAIKKFFDDLGNKILIDTGILNDFAKAEQQAADQDAERQKINSGATSALQDLFKQRNDTQAQIQQLQAQLGNVQVRPGTKDTTAARETRNKNADIQAQIDALQRQVDQQNALIKSTKKLQGAINDLNNNWGTEAVDKFTTELSKVHGLEGLAGESADQLFSSLVAIAGQFGLTAKQTLVFFNAIIAMKTALDLIDGYKATVTIEVQRINTYAQQGEDVYTPGQQGPPRPTSTQDPTVQALIDHQNKVIKDQQDTIDRLLKAATGGAAFKPPPTVGSGAGGSTKDTKLQYSIDELNDTIKKSEQFGYSTQKQDVAAIQANIDKITSQLTPQQRKDLENNRVQLFNGTQLIGTFKTSSEILTKAMQALADIEQKRLDFDTKADAIRRIRIGSGDFAAIANVPYNKQNNISVGSGGSPINVNINGQLLTPAQFQTLANQIAAIIKAGIAAQ